MLCSCPHGCGSFAFTVMRIPDQRAQVELKYATSVDLVLLLTVYIMCNAENHIRGS